MIISVQLINWRSHANTILEFKKGANLLIGAMGAGKSSVLDAISFSLFGTFPALERRKLKLDDLIRTNENSSLLNLHFKWDGINYKVRRTIERTKKGTATDAMLWKNDQLVEKGTTSVTGYLEQALSVDYDIFTRAIYSEQNNIDYFFVLDPRKRKEEMDALLGLDKFEMARANIISIINRIKNSRSDLERIFNKDEFLQFKNKRELTIKTLKNITQNIETAEQKLIETRKQLQNTEERLLSIKKEKELFEKLHREELKLSERITMLSSYLKLNSFDTAKTKEVAERKNHEEARRTFLNHNFEIINNGHRQLTKEHATVVYQMENAGKLLSEKTALEKTKKTLLAGITTGPEELEKEVFSISAEKTMLEKELSQLAEVSLRLITDQSTCPICGSLLVKEKVEHIAKERQMQKADKEIHLGTLTKNLESKKKHLEDEKRMVNNMLRIEEQLNALKIPEIKLLETKEAEIKKSLDDNSSKLKEIQNELEILRKRSEETSLLLHQIKVWEDRTKELDAAQLQYAAVRKELQGNTFDEKTAEELRKNYEQQKITCERISGEKSSLKQQYDNMQESFSELERTIGRLASIEMELLFLNTLEEECVIYKNALVETQITLRTELVQAINFMLNNLWSIFYPYKNYRALRLSVSEKDYIFEIFNSEWKQLESIASGGERACAALVLRVALATVLTPKLSWLVLDEPTHNLDKEAVELLSHTLQFKVPEVVEQAFIITHEEGLMGSEFASTYKLSRNKEDHEATKAERV